MYCTNCGNIVNEGTKFCAHCGTPIQTAANTNDHMAYYAAPVTVPIKRKKNNSAIKIVAVCMACVFAVGLICSGLLILNYKKDGADTSVVDDSSEWYMESVRTVEHDAEEHSTMVSEKHYNSAGKIVEVTEEFSDESNPDFEGVYYSYDSENRLVRMSSLGEDEGVIEFDEYTEENGYVISGWQNEDGRMSIKYDKNGNMIEFCQYNVDSDELVMYRSCSYYDDGSLKTMKERQSYFIFEYEYNEDGMITKSKSFIEDYKYKEQINSGLYEYKNRTYWMNIDVKGYEDVKSSEGKITDKGTYKEIKYENRFEEKDGKLYMTCFENGVFTGYYICEFDENGNIIKESSYSADDILKSETEYTWQKK